jgi:glutamate/aspartate transport system substrate-binding protein
MKRKSMIGYALAAALCADTAMAQELTGTLKNIKETGAITLGHRDSSILLFPRRQPEPIGYAPDLLQDRRGREEGAQARQARGQGLRR